MITGNGSLKKTDDGRDELLIERDGKMVALARTDEKGVLALNNDLLLEMTDRDERKMALSMFQRASETLEAKKKELTEHLANGVNIYLGAYKEMVVARQTFKEKLEDVARHPWLNLQKALHDLKDNYGGLIKATNSFDIHFDSYKEIKDVTSKVDYIAGAYQNEETEFAVKGFVENTVVEKAVEGLLPQIERLKALSEPIVKYEDTTRNIFGGKIDHYDMATAVKECMDAIRQGIDLENAVELTDEVYAFVDKDRAVERASYSYNMHKLCEKITEFYGGSTEAFLDMSNMNKTGEKDVDFVRNVYPDEFKTIVGEIMDKSSIKFGDIAHIDIRAVECAYYGFGNACFEVEIAKKNGTTFNLLFDPKCEVAQICKSDIGKETGECIFNRANNKHWIDFSVTNNGETKTLIDQMPCVKESVDKFCKEHHGQTHEQIIGRQNPSKM